MIFKKSMKKAFTQTFCLFLTGQLMVSNQYLKYHYPYEKISK